MNTDQKKWMRKMNRVLQEGRRLGLQGGVYSGIFCAWPTRCRNPQDFEEKGECDFFEGVDRTGGEYLTGKYMHLDGGAGN